MVNGVVYIIWIKINKNVLMARERQTNKYASFLSSVLTKLMDEFITKSSFEGRTKK